jgi:hypothetical protein
VAGGAKFAGRPRKACRSSADRLIEKPDVDATAALVRRFPDHACSIMRLGAADATFRAICEDYADALRALAHWQAADFSSRKKAEEYRRMVEELEDEALAALMASKNN